MAIYLHHVWRLRHFLDVHSAGSFHGAAKLNNISQPALTKSVQILETQIGAKVFDRTTTGVTLTSAGEALLKRAKSIEDEWNAASIEINSRTSGASGRIALGAGPVYSANVFPDLLSKMSTIFPNLQISLSTGVGANLFPVLKSGAISLYAGALPTSIDGLGDEFETVFIKEQTNTLLASRDHPLMKKKFVSAEDLLAYPWLRMLYDRDATEEIERYFGSLDLGSPRVLIETQSLAVAFALIEKKQFLASQPIDLVAGKQHVGVGTLNFPEFNWKIRTGITYRKSALELEPIRVAIEMLTNDGENLNSR